MVKEKKMLPSSESPGKLKIPERPEPHTVPVSIKIQESVNRALAEAAKEKGMSRSYLVAAVIKAWLESEGYL